MLNRVQWDPRHSVGNETLDDQHRAIAARCNALADCLEDAPDADEPKFDQIFNDLMTAAHEHFAIEEALLARCGYPELADHQSEREEFEYLAAEIVTTENFDRHELQSFLALWWIGHIRGCAAQHRAYLEGEPGA